MNPLPDQPAVKTSHKFSKSSWLCPSSIFAALGVTLSVVSLCQACDANKFAKEANSISKENKELAETQYYQSINPDSVTVSADGKRSSDESTIVITITVTNGMDRVAKDVEVWLPYEVRLWPKQPQESNSQGNPTEPKLAPKTEELYHLDLRDKKGTLHRNSIFLGDIPPTNSKTGTIEIPSTENNIKINNNCDLRGKFQTVSIGIVTKNETPKQWHEMRTNYQTKEKDDYNIDKCEVVNLVKKGEDGPKTPTIKRETKSQMNSQFKK